MRSFLMTVGALIALSFVVPDLSWWQVAVQVLTGYTVAFVLFRRRFWAFGAGIAGNASGILYEGYALHVHGAYASPSWQDVGYLMLYPGLALGLVILIRRRTKGRDWGAIVDATTVTTGLGLLAWVFMIRPAVTDTDGGLLGHVVGIAYPVGDVVLLAMLTRLLLGAGARSTAYWLMSAGIGLFLVADATWAVLNTVEVEPGPLGHRMLGGSYLAAYALFGAAVLHPSVRGLGDVAPVTPRLGRGLLVLLTVASLMAPLLLLGEVTAGQVTDALPIAVCSIVLFLLVIVRMAQLLSQLETQTRKVRELSLTDELTGLPNRRSWNAELPAAVERARRDGRGLALVMVDLDHFKKFNDEYGHPAGDRLLKSAAAAWSSAIRASDTLARYGGEEFAALLPGPDPLPVVERMMAVTPLGQTFSAGLACWDGREASDELLARADAALYDAKRRGRNQVQVSELVGPGG